MYERTLTSTRAYTGRVLALDLLEIETDQGVRAKRDIVRHRGAVAVLCRRPDGMLVLVRQFRKPVEKILLEVVAGKLEADENPEVCARREVLEETGHTVTALRSLGFIHPTPGYSDETLHLFEAQVDATPQAHQADADEDLATVTLTPAEFEARIASGEIVDAKTLCIWLLACLKGRKAEVGDQKCPSNTH